jgi:TetR/AcrR family transcriptional regulator, ethionamide resistance regulator
MASVTRRSGAGGSDRRSAMEENLQRAMERLLEKGSSFTQVSVEQLATEAGISRATFYLHFRDKGELVARLMTRVTAELSSAARLVSLETVTREELRKTVRAVVRAYSRHYAVMAAIVETSAYDAQVDALFQQMMEQLVEVNRRALLRLKRAGRLSAEVSPQLADVITWAFERSCHQLIRKRKPAQVNAVIDALTHMIWSSVYAPD